MRTGDKEDIWDVVVIGGGPAGMMAAGAAAKGGCRVLLLEKNAVLGKKLLITGGGRCNLTNAEPDIRKLLTRYKNAGKFLSSPFAKWSNQETIAFFHDRGMPTKVEAEQRVFPLANTAKAVLDTLRAYMKDSGVHVRSNAVVTNLVESGSKLAAAKLRDGSVIYAKTFILATGGVSHPETGSTGDGYAWLKALGHTVREPSMALVPVAVKDAWVRRAAGVTLNNAGITLFQGGQKKNESTGKVLFTHVGVSGPGILNVSRYIGELLEYGECTIEIDLRPNVGYEAVDAKIQESFKKHHMKKVRNALGEMVPRALVPVLLSLAEIDPETLCNQISRTARMRLMKAIKHVRLEAKGLLGPEKAVITSGGVDLREIDLRTMRSLRCENLYLVGDILDIDRPSGGYSLQICWTTGQIAGLSAAAALMRPLSP